jgi:hypothetical protein
VPDLPASVSLDDTSGPPWDLPLTPKVFFVDSLPLSARGLFVSASADSPTSFPAGFNVLSERFFQDPDAGTIASFPSLSCAPGLLSHRFLPMLTAITPPAPTSAVFVLTASRALRASSSLSLFVSPIIALLTLLVVCCRASLL